MSAGNNNRTISDSAAVRVKELEALAQRDYGDIDPNWKLQLGTLGGGNHFIELATDESDTVWATLHSGSRGIGNKIGNLHIRRAQTLAKANGVSLPDRDLAYLTEGTDGVRRVHPRCAVGAELRPAQSRRDDGPRDDRAEPARLRRRRSCRRARSPAHQLPSQLHAARGALRPAHLGDAQRRDRGTPRHVGDDSRIDGHAQLHRDGPASNPMAFSSAPHGAGRRLSRTAARRQYTMSDLDTAMRGHRVPPVVGAARRDSVGLQGHRRGDGAREGAGRGEVRAQAIRQCEGD